MNSLQPLHLELGDGLRLSLSSRPPDPELLQIVLPVSGGGVWRQGDLSYPMAAQSVWWLGGMAGTWAPPESGAPGVWFSLSGSRCPVPELEGTFALFPGLAQPRPLPGLLPEVRELMEIATTCRYPCELRNLLARGKGLMVVSKVLHSLNTDAPARAYDVRFFQDDLDKVRQARELILQRMTGPPTLAQLAREVGLNELKLKAGFRRLWGITVFGLLKQERLVLARRLLESGECNVSGAAFRVGYTNTSHFAKSFSAQFGVSPGVVARSSGG